ncbi:hypothetical protein [Vitiosangium sp. GDMCC 1.1324]|uniref:hypothetical protein n=1 Tax=Vitiosangium sp. (strain GDMCC 1.1324) TaxID=2138576 RepID=UPI000D3A111F|nr:hypothetical protein [Vitiosangium sp. GDMCC 1.1324]PTL76731.1 hypothetical protein DAT35_48245 [Vitiosangium sp. GDMCC 1.1324]
MKRLVPALAVLALVAGFAAPAQAQVELHEVALSTQLASTVTTIQPQCYYCTSLTVTAFAVDSSGAISQEDATWAAFDWLGAQDYQVYPDAGHAITQTQFASALANKNYEELPPAIRSYIGTYGNDYTVSVASWARMTAPDYYNFGDFYTLVFHTARKVVTVEVRYEYEW